jgi:hypothetical protein
MRTVQFEGHTLTIHDREDWQDPKLPVHSTNAFEWDTDTEAVHYTAAVDLPDGDPDELVPGKPEWWLVPSYLRRIQADYQNNRGYAIGYNWPIDYLGGIWEARGWDFECAANVGWNPRTWAILLLVDGNDAPNPWMLRSCRYLHHEAQRLSGRTHLIRPHSQLGYNVTTKQQILYPFPGGQTSCPGNGGRAKMIVPSGLQGGEYNWKFYQAPVEPPPVVTPPIPTPIPPTPTPPSLDQLGEDMPFIVKKSNGETAVVYGSGKMTGLAGSDIPAFVDKFGPALPVADVTWNDFANKGKT